MTKNEILQTIELRQSTIKDYLSCALMYRFKHIQKILQSSRHSSALHGTSLHKVIHRLHTESWKLDLKQAYLEALDEAIAENDIPVFWKETREKYLDNALEILQGYKDNPQNIETLILFSEVKFRVKIHGHLFTGTIDQIRKNADNTLELVDLKSAKQRPSLAFLVNDIQLSLYQYALKYGELLVDDEWIKPRLTVKYCSWVFLRSYERYKRKCKGGNIGDLKGESLIRTQRNNEGLKVFKKELKNLLNVMLRDWAYPNQNHCQLCGFKEICMSRSQGGYDLSEEEREQIKDIN